jgi:hypothetical protein
MIASLGLLDAMTTTGLRGLLWRPPGIRCRRSSDQGFYYEQGEVKIRCYAPGGGV